MFNGLACKGDNLKARELNSNSYFINGIEIEKSCTVWKKEKRVADVT